MPHPKLIRLCLSSALLAASPSFALAQAAPAPAAAPAAAAFTPTHITVRAGGSGPDVILIPGLASPRDVWKTELPKILAHNKVHLVQVDGFAGSKPGANADMKSGLLDAIVADLDQYIQANHLQSPAIIGHSMGGLLALMLADKHPNDVGKILIVDSLPWLGGLFDATEKDVRDQARSMKQSYEEASKDQALRGSLSTAQTMVTAKDDQNLVALWSANSDRHVVAEAMYEDMTTDLRADMANIQTPITVLWPYYSDEGKIGDVQRTYTQQYSKAPHATLVRVDNSRHFIMMDQPQKFDEAVQAFLKS